VLEHDAVVVVVVCRVLSLDFWLRVSCVYVKEKKVSCVYVKEMKVLCEGNEGASG